jgi:CheY-like chemotaxis protein
MAIENFLLVENNSFDNFLSRTMIRHLKENTRIKSFSEPGECLGFIEHSYSAAIEKPTVILLDINLPRMSAWEFIENFELLHESIRNQFSIYILSSSIEGRDKNRIFNTPIIKGYLQKPLEKEAVSSMLEEHSHVSAGLQSASA